MSSDDPARRLGDIIENIDRIVAYPRDLDLETYASSDMAKDAVERCFQRITEASIKLHPDHSGLLPDHDWDSMRGLGNRLRHDYSGISDTVIWDTIRHDLPRLRTDCMEALEKMTST